MMRRPAYAILLYFIICVYGRDVDFDNVNILDRDNFLENYEYRNKDYGLFILFYSNESSWSKIALKELSNAAKILSNTKVKFSAISVESHFDLPINVELYQIPCLYYFFKEEMDIYKGTFSHVEIMNWVLIKLVTDLTISTNEALEAVLNVPESHEALTLIVSKDNKFSVSNFISIPSVVHLASLCIFFYINSEPVIKELENKILDNLSTEDLEHIESGKDYVLILRKFKMKPYASLYKNSLQDSDSVIKFIKYESIPLLIDANSRMLPKLVDLDKEKNLEDVVNLEKLCGFFDHHHYESILVNLSSDNIVDSPIIDLLGIDIESKLAIRAIWKDASNGKIRKYRPEDFTDDAFDYDKFFEFAKKIIENKLQPYFKSQPRLPISVDQGPVKTIVGSDFYERVINSNEDVIVMIYATWCGHCHKLRPVWRDLGLLLKNVKNIVVAKLDGVNNEIEDLYLSYFPTIRMYPHGMKSQPVEFLLDLTLENLLSFVKDTARLAKFDPKQLISTPYKEPLFEKYNEL